MGSVTLLCLLLPVSLANLVSSGDDPATLAGFAADDQCAEGDDCALNALQLRGQGAASPDEHFALVEASTTHYNTAWKELITGTSCPSATALTAKGGAAGGKITCKMSGGGRHFKFPAGKFDIDEQVNVPAGTVIEGNANPNNPSDQTQKPNPSTQTYFVATKGVTSRGIAYCGTHNNLKPGGAEKLRIGFLLNSNTVVKNINFQGRDTQRPDDNGSLCGGAVFETPGCVSPGFCNGPGTSWVGKTGCHDRTGKPNSLVTGHGKGVSNVVIDSVRLNDLIGGMGSQIAVWVAQTKDGSATKNIRVNNLVSMHTRGDGINFHGNVQNSVVENSYIANTGDDIYAIWGGYGANPSGIVFKNNVASNPGVTRGYTYGVCMAVYGVKDATITGMKCYDRRHWKGKCVNNGPFCNSCLAFIHDGWFGAVYPHGSKIHFYDNDYLYMDKPSQAITDRPLFRRDSGNAKIVTSPR